MRVLLVAGCAMALAVSPMSVAAQEADDDWEFAEDAARGLTVAMVRYEGGQAVVAQCLRGELKAVIVGLPAAAGTGRTLLATRWDDRADRQVWTMEAAPSGRPATFTSSTPARDLRFMRGGGAFNLRSEEGQAAPVRATFDLPTQSTSLDRVLTACGHSVADDRDRLVRAPENLRYGQEPSSSSPQTPEGPPPAPTGRLVSVVNISCIVRAMQLTECRVDHAIPAGSGDRTARQMNGMAVRTANEATAEGTVFYSQLSTYVDMVGTEHR